MSIFRHSLSDIIEELNENITTIEKYSLTARYSNISKELSFIANDLQQSATNLVALGNYVYANKHAFRSLRRYNPAKIILRNMLLNPLLIPLAYKSAIATTFVVNYFNKFIVPGMFGIFKFLAFVGENKKDITKGLKSFRHMMFGKKGWLRGTYGIRGWGKTEGFIPLATEIGEAVVDIDVVDAALTLTAFRFLVMDSLIGIAKSLVYFSQNKRSIRKGLRVLSLMLFGGKDGFWIFKKKYDSLIGIMLALGIVGFGSVSKMLKVSMQFIAMAVVIESLKVVVEGLHDIGKTYGIFGLWIRQGIKAIRKVVPALTTVMDDIEKHKLSLQSLFNIALMFIAIKAIVYAISSLSLPLILFGLVSLPTLIGIGAMILLVKGIFCVIQTLDKISFKSIGLAIVKMTIISAFILGNVGMVALISNIAKSQLDVNSFNAVMLFIIMALIFITIFGIIIKIMIKMSESDIKKASTQASAIATMILGASLTATSAGLVYLINKLSENSITVDKLITVGIFTAAALIIILGTFMLVKLISKINIDDSTNDKIKSINLLLVGTAAGAAAAASIASMIQKMSNTEMTVTMFKAVGLFLASSILILATVVGLSYLIAKLKPISEDKRTNMDTIMRILVGAGNVAAGAAATAGLVYAIKTIKELGLTAGDLLGVLFFTGAAISLVFGMWMIAKMITKMGKDVITDDTKKTFENILHIAVGTVVGGLVGSGLAAAIQVIKKLGITQEDTGAVVLFTLSSLILVAGLWAIVTMINKMFKSGVDIKTVLKQLGAMALIIGVLALLIYAISQLQMTWDVFINIGLFALATILLIGLILLIIKLCIMFKKSWFIKANRTLLNMAAFILGIAFVVLIVCLVFAIMSNMKEVAWGLFLQVTIMMIVIVGLALLLAWASSVLLPVIVVADVIMLSMVILLGMIALIAVLLLAMTGLAKKIKTKKKEIVESMRAIIQTVFEVVDILINPTLKENQNGIFNQRNDFQGGFWDNAGIWGAKIVNIVGGIISGIFGFIDLLVKVNVLLLALLSLGIIYLLANMILGINRLYKENQSEFENAVESVRAIIQWVFKVIDIIINPSLAEDANGAFMQQQEYNKGFGGNFVVWGGNLVNMLGDIVTGIVGLVDLIIKFAVLFMAFVCIGMLFAVSYMIKELATKVAGWDWDSIITNIINVMFNIESVIDTICKGGREGFSKYEDNQKEDASWLEKACNWFADKAITYGDRLLGDLGDIFWLLMKTVKLTLALLVCGLLLAVVTSIDKISKKIATFNAETISTRINKFYQILDVIIKEASEHNDTIKKWGDIMLPFDDDKAVNNFTKITSQAGWFTNKINGLNLSKLVYMTELFGNMAAFSKSINGNFDKLADAIVEKLAPLIEELNDTIKEADEHIRDAQRKVEEAYNRAQQANEQAASIINSAEAANENNKLSKYVAKPNDNSAKVKQPFASDTKKTKALTELQKMNIEELLRSVIYGNQSVRICTT